ncbi:response regulator [Cupriavidus basilensis]|uniref:Response regulator n=1 Tax=Cupriavidus basilensis TaxID=68895 RepID=A0ABT6AID1_9BURK|nr:response regulator [Cupriavidus basilensis]MDF3832371.1 response regulator [Cupriavidus basilensis]
MSLRILLADDHPAITLAVRSQLRGQTGWEICADVRNSAELLQAARAFRPDIVVTDYHMPCGTASDGIRLLANLRRHHPALGVVVLTMITNPLVLRAILNAGAHGLLLKDSQLDELVTAIVRVERGLRFVGESAARVLDQSGAHYAPGRAGAIGLSVRESEVLRLYLSGNSVTAIAGQLCRSIKTISRQKNSAMRKLGVSNERELFDFAAHQGLVLPRRDAPLASAYGSPSEWL